MGLHFVYMYYTIVTRQDKVKQITYTANSIKFKKRILTRPIYLSNNNFRDPFMTHFIRSYDKQIIRFRVVNTYVCCRFSSVHD